mmetsp:Transcript_5236/g.8783  ORF Transcript_5236/g.8783 Transcript_5236/m.8783 type:complete len:168 (+) Transcript_5236:40-543(+)
MQYCSASLLQIPMQHLHFPLPCSSLPLSIIATSLGTTTRRDNTMPITQLGRLAWWVGPCAARLHEHNMLGLRVKEFLVGACADKAYRWERHSASLDGDEVESGRVRESGRQLKAEQLVSTEQKSVVFSEREAQRVQRRTVVACPQTHTQKLPEGALTRHLTFDLDVR